MPTTSERTITIHGSTRCASISITRARAQHLDGLKHCDDPSTIGVVCEHAARKDQQRELAPTARRYPIRSLMRKLPGLSSNQGSVTCCDHIPILDSNVATKKVPIEPSAKAEAIAGTSRQVWHGDLKWHAVSRKR